MKRNNEFLELIARVSRGDADAAGVLVRRYETAVRVAIRIRLSDPILRRQLDSMDVCQSVLASFFIRAATGAFDLHGPRQLVALLMKMAQNKLATHARNQYRQRRDVRRLHESFGARNRFVSSAPGPARHVEGKELLNRALELMSTETRGIAERRMRGESWLEIAAVIGGTPEARRKQYDRAVAHIADVLDIHGATG
jgi:DNA-directed RNA polymerase specialized sigma24 family protein